MVESIFDTRAQWLAQAGPEGDVALFTHLTLVRNLSDFPFPDRATVDEKRAVEERVVEVLDALSLMEEGQYWSLDNLERREVRFLIERQLVMPLLTERYGARGVFVSSDQSMAIEVNSGDHVRMHVLAPGLQLQESWAKLSMLDDTLAGALDYAFGDRYGFLTSALNETGTGLRASVALQLPGMNLRGQVPTVLQRVAQRGHGVDVFCPNDGSASAIAIASGTKEKDAAGWGNVLIVRNQATLGRSEEETVFHLRHLVTELIEEERRDRDALKQDQQRSLDDYVGRALGVARGARMMEYGEVLAIVSALRLGKSVNAFDGLSTDRLNTLMILAQDAHLEMKAGHDCDAEQVKMERADLVRISLS